MAQLFSKLGEYGFNCWQSYAAYFTWVAFTILSWGIGLSFLSDWELQNSSIDADTALRLTEITSENIRVNGSQSLAWFMFACTINGAVAALLAQFKNPLELRVLPGLMIVNNAMLAIGFAGVLPYYYLSRTGYIYAVLSQVSGIGSRVILSTPCYIWSACASLVSLTLLAMALM